MTAVSTDDTRARLERLPALWSRARPAVMGIVNCTPDSFSDGGLLPDADAATTHAERLLADGADVIDVGGESTRPGAVPIAADRELRRVLPVIERLRARHPSAVLSVDTAKAAVAEAALAAGADIVNDVTAASDPRMSAVVAAADAAIVLMHMRGTPRTMQADLRYRHVVAEVHETLRASASRLMAVGIPREHIWLDPGIGFGKDDAGNLALLAALPQLATLGHPVVVGPSRKSFIGRITGADVTERLPGTLASLIPAIGCPRMVVRVHDVRETVQFLTVAAALERSSA